MEVNALKSRVHGNSEEDGWQRMVQRNTKLHDERSKVLTYKGTLVMSREIPVLETAPIESSQKRKACVKTRDPKMDAPIMSYEEVESCHSCSFPVESRDDQWGDRDT